MYLRGFGMHEDSDVSDCYEIRGDFWQLTSFICMNMNAGQSYVMTSFFKS